MAAGLFAFSDRKENSPTSRDDLFTTSENVRSSSSSVRSRSKRRRVGGTKSAVKFVAIRAVSGGIPSTRLPFMSLRVSFVNERNVVVLLMASWVYLFKLFRSSTPS